MGYENLGGVPVEVAIAASLRSVVVAYSGGVDSAFLYDSAGEMTQRINARGNTTSYAYDSAGDRTIVNPKDLSIDLREAVCQQCHLQTGGNAVVRPGLKMFDFRPGLPLHLFFEQYLTREPPGARGPSEGADPPWAPPERADPPRPRAGLAGRLTAVASPSRRLSLACPGRGRRGFADRVS